jgi:hypothetical protein
MATAIHMNDVLTQLPNPISAIIFFYNIPDIVPQLFERTDRIDEFAQYLQKISDITSLPPFSEQVLKFSGREENFSSAPLVVERMILSLLFHEEDIGDAWIDGLTPESIFSHPWDWSQGTDKCMAPLDGRGCVNRRLTSSQFCFSCNPYRDSVWKDIKKEDPAGVGWGRAASYVNCLYYVLALRGVDVIDIIRYYSISDLERLPLILELIIMRRLPMLDAHEILPFIAKVASLNALCETDIGDDSIINSDGEISNCSRLKECIKLVNKRKERLLSILDDALMRLTSGEKDIKHAEYAKITKIPLHSISYEAYISMTKEASWIVEKYFFNQFKDIVEETNQKLGRLLGELRGICISSKKITPNT